MTGWLQWFLAGFTRAIDVAAAGGEGVLRKAEFWRSHQDLALSERQRAILNLYLDGFEGHLTARQWAILGKCSPASARRDIADLVDKGVLRRNPGGGKNTRYGLVPSRPDTSLERWAPVGAQSGDLQNGWIVEIVDALAPAAPADLSHPATRNPRQFGRGH